MSISEQTHAAAIGGVERDTMRRVTARIIPFLLACYFISFLDRVNVSFAALQMNHALSLTPATYGLGAGLFFLTYCVFEVPSNLALHRVGATRWIARIMLSWGLLAAGMAFVVGPTSFYVMRLLLGAAEAGFFPGVLFFLTLWFPAAYRGRILGLFMAGVALSGLIGAPLSGFLLSLDGFAGLQGWQWLFILEGLPAVILAPLALVLLKDRPADARWLTPQQSGWLGGVLSSERRERETLRTHSVLQALTDLRVLVLALMYFTNVCLLNAVLFFLPLIIKEFGLSNAQTGLVAAIPSACALVAVIWWGRRSDTSRDRYAYAALPNLVAGVALLLSVLVSDPALRIACLAVASAGTLAFTPPFWAIPASFLSGAAAAAGIAAISSLGVLGGFVAPSLIGYLRGVTGSFGAGLGGVAILAIVVTIGFYFFGRRQDSSGVSLALPSAASRPGAAQTR